MRALSGTIYSLFDPGRPVEVLLQPFLSADRELYVGFWIPALILAYLAYPGR
jgi:hypothetical protein